MCRLSFACLTACICVCTDGSEKCSYRSSHIFPRPFTTYRCPSVPVRQRAQGERQKSFFNANDTASGWRAFSSRICPRNAELTRPSVSVPFGSSARPVQAVRPPLSSAPRWSLQIMDLLGKRTSVVPAILMWCLLSSGHISRSQTNRPLLSPKAYRPHSLLQPPISLYFLLTPIYLQRNAFCLWPLLFFHAFNSITSLSIS